MFDIKVHIAFERKNNNLLMGLSSSNYFDNKSGIVTFLHKVSETRLLLFCSKIFRLQAKIIFMTSSVDTNKNEFV